MKALKVFITIIFSLTFSNCKKDNPPSQIIPIPNGGFEDWNNQPNLLYWQTNSCPECLPPFETYIVQKVTDAHSGQFAAKFIYNNVYKSWADNKFSVAFHPSFLEAYVKANITNGDTVCIHIDLFSGTNITDSANWYGTASIGNYEKVEIPVSHASSTADSALITIIGGG